MLFSYFIIFSFSSIYSIDLGAQNVRIAVSVPGKPVEIKLNDRDQRMTSNYIAFPLKEKLEKFEFVQWLIGSDAERIYMRNTSYGIANPFGRLWTPDNMDFNGIHPVLTASTALYHHLKSFKLKNDKLTLIVPTYASPQYRQLLLLTSKMTGFKSNTILDSSTAVATYYSVEKIKKGSRKPISILFIDIGAENAECSLWKYKPLGDKINIELLQYHHSSQIGGNYVDRLIMNHVAPQLGRPLVGSEMYIVANLLRKAKERLSGGDSIGVDLNEDFGKYITVSQEEIRNLTANMSEKIVELVSDISPPDEIELIGGSSRLQVFIDAITRAFPDIPIRRSLNSDEASALGAAYYTALKTGTVIGSKLDIRKPAIFGLNATIDDQPVEIFKPGDIIKEKKFPMNGTKTHMIKQNLDLDTYDEYIIDSVNFNRTKTSFNEILLEGIEKALEPLKDQMINNTVPTFMLKFGLSQELDTFDLVEAMLVVNVTGTARTRARRMLSNTKEVKLPFFSIPSDPSFRIPPNASVFLKKMMHADEDRLNREESCHKLETFIIETRDAAQYDTDMNEVTTQEERERIIRILDDAREKLDCTNMDAYETSDSLERKLRNLRADIVKPLERYEDKIKRHATLKNLEDTIKRAENAKLNHKCDSETLESFEKYLNETYDKLEKMKNDKPLDQPSFPVSEMKERDKEILKKIPEVLRPPKKSNIINYSTSNSTDMDDEEYERLKNAGISVSKPKKKRRVEDNPEEKERKEKRIYELEKAYNSSKAAFNQSRKMFVKTRKAFEKEHNLQSEPWDDPDEGVERRKFVEEEEYLARKAKKEAKIRAKEEEIEKQKQEELRRIEEEKNRPPTPTPTPEEAERLRKLKEIEEKKRLEEEENRRRIEEEKNLFREIGADMIDKLDQQDEETLNKRYKELKRKFDNERHAPFDNEAEREKYMEERKEYEELQRRFDNPIKRRKEKERKDRAKKKKEEKERLEESKTDLDVRIEELEIDQRRLIRDLEILKDDIQDFEKLKKQILRKEVHDRNKRKRRQEREKKEIERRNKKWEERSHNLLSDSETSDDSDTSFYDTLPIYWDIDFDESSSSVESETEESTSSSSSCFSSSETETSEELNRRRKADFEFERKARDKLKIRHLIDPVNVTYELDQKEIKELKRKGFSIPDPKELYKDRYELSKKSYDEEYEREKREKHKSKPINPDDNLTIKRESQDDEISEDEL